MGTILRETSYSMLIGGSMESFVFVIFIINFLRKIKGHVYKFEVLGVYSMKEIRIK